MKTYSAKPGEVQRNWWVVDADGKNLGRLASEIAIVLRGKNKPQYTPHTDTGDFVVVVNAEKIAVTGNKMTEQDLLPALRLSGRSEEPRPSASCCSGARPKCCARPSRACCPRTGWPRSSLRKLKIYAGPKHPHAAQKPEELPWQQ